VFTIFVGNTLGRKKTIFIGSIIMTIGALLQCTSYDLPQWIIGRLVTGWGNGMNTSTVPMWQSETAKSHQRGKLVMIEGMLITAGITISYWINYGFAWIGENEVAWRFPLAFQIFFCLIIFGMIMNLPESPRWLIMQGKEEEALEVLEYVGDMTRDDPVIMTEFDDVKQTVIEMSKGSYRSLFEMTDYREFHRVILAYTNQMFQQISGINLITYYAPTLYAGIGLGQNNYPKLLAACNGTEYLMASFIPIFIVEKVGRRPLMLFGSAGMALSMAALAVSNFYVTRDPNNVNTQAGIAQAVFLFVFNSFFAVGW
jgi:MFS family permease